MQVQIKFITSGSNSAFGSFEPGGLLRCSADIAKHLVEEAGVAKYTAAPSAEQTAADTPPAKSPRKSKTK